MISDVLAEAVSEIDRDLREDHGAYQGELRPRILLVRNAMEDLREELDTPPSEEEVN